MLHPTRSLVSPLLVGRDITLETLNHLLHEAADGHGQVVVLNGEAGIGKSRLAAEGRARAEALGYHYLGGRCFEPDATVPFALLTDLLRGRFAGRSAAEMRCELGPAAPELGRLMPELAALSGIDAPPPLDPE